MQVKGFTKSKGSTEVNLKLKFFSYAWKAVNIIYLNLFV